MLTRGPGNSNPIVFFGGGNAQICLTLCLSIISWNISPPVFPINLFSAGVSYTCDGVPAGPNVRLVHLILPRVDEGLNMASVFRCRVE